jgi:succinate dehydrogenase / fumarate reductase flavoprotein subunit
MANYTEIIEGRATPNGGVFLDISHQSKENIIKKLPRMYRQFLDTLMIDISKTPMEVSPTAHYSMGGIVVRPDDHATNIEGLYAAGEVTGGLHGANRLGGNSLAEILIFGKRAGKHAAERSLNMDIQYRSRQVIKRAHEKIDAFIKNGSEVARPLQRELRNIMWEHCGVVRHEDKLQEGLQRIARLKASLKNLDVRPDSEGFEDLMLAFDLEGSIMSAEATILGAIARKESRGAHQRSDFKETKTDFDANFKIKLEDTGELKVSKQALQALSEELGTIVNTTQEITDFKGLLLE